MLSRGTRPASLNGERLSLQAAVEELPLTNVALNSNRFGFEGFGRRTSYRLDANLQPFRADNIKVLKRFGLEFFGAQQNPEKDHINIMTVNITTFQVLSRGCGVHNTKYVDTSLQSLACCLGFGIPF